MPGPAYLQVLKVLLLSASLFLVGATVACGFLLLGAVCSGCFASETRADLLLSIQSVLWPFAHRYALVPSSQVSGEVQWLRLAFAVLENGVIYAAIGMTAGIVFEKWRHFRFRATKERTR